MDYSRIIVTDKEFRILVNAEIKEDRANLRKQIEGSAYEFDLNEKRIRKYTSIAEEYNIDKSIVGQIFSKGIDWHESEILKLIDNGSR